MGHASITGNTPIQSVSETSPLLDDDSPHSSSTLVTLDGPDDPMDPMNMPEWRKWACASILGAMTFAATFSSAVFSAAAPSTAKELHVTPETMSWATSLYVFGFATGPVLMGPASELYGRKMPFFIGYVGFILSQIPVGLAQDIRTILLFRFLGGVASAGSPAIVGGYMADFLPPVERGVAVAIFAATTLIGPSVGSIVGAVLVESSWGWRWTAWLSLILGLVFSIMGYFILPETYVPVLLKRKAHFLRRQTQNLDLHSALEEKPVSITDFLVRYLSRPFVMLFLEPILFSMTMYISFTFGMVYLLFMAYPISFVQQRHWGLVNGTLPSISIIVGIILGSAYVVHYTLTTLRRKFRKEGQISPEDRLPPMIVAAGLLPVGLFWFAWTSSPSLNAWPQVLAGVPIGFGLQVILLQSLAYLIDIYTTNANSAIAGTVVVRSLLGGVFPLLAIPMYQRLGVPWATSVLGLCGIVFAPVPVLFYLYGPKIRKSSKYVLRN
ncbi:major facilitator superfamily domain-containing protein [Aspergillus avenaceus]|uniref:Major facilitator superfamily domain-containing protein n=1 Tax=Aspergillus avenaceus TaxID=36643 RepID=A0A5N6TJS1_ASPAV|nr:major facilitator superfamily domain-containing protein [Aspergillus avenaceus]